ncbi:MAG: recombinase family protein [Candidatus Saccharimonadales bacterium]
MNATTNKKPILLIARVSDVQQRKALPAQKQRLENYARTLNYKDKEWRYHEFDESAYKDARQKFASLIEDEIQSLNEQAIIVFDKIDRFTRDASQREVRIMGQLVEKDKIELHFPSDNLFISSSSPATDLFRLGIGMLLAKYYSDSSRDNVKRRFEQMLNDGIWVHRAPIGYQNISIPTSNPNKPLKDIVVDEQRAHYIVKAFELRAIGMPYSLIAKELAKAGFTSSKTGKTTLSKGAVEAIINNKFYYGMMTQKGKDYPHNYAPLIDRALFNRCQLIKDKRKSMKTKWDSLNFNFSDILSCGKCGRTISPFQCKRWVYLKCANSKCSNPNTAESLVLGSMEALVKRINIPEKLLNKVIKELKDNHDDQQKYYSQSLLSVREEYDSIDKKIEMWFEKLVDEKISPEQHDKIVETLTNRQQQLNDRLNVLTRGNKDFLVTASYLLDLVSRVSELFQLADEGQRSKLLGFLVSNLKLNDKNLSYTVNYPFNLVIEEKEKAPDGAKTQLWCG